MAIFFMGRRSQLVGFFLRDQSQLISAPVEQDLSTVHCWGDTVGDLLGIVKKIRTDFAHLKKKHESIVRPVFWLNSELIFVTVGIQVLLTQWIDFEHPEQGG